jgi:hypothetical protein
MLKLKYKIIDMKHNINLYQHSKKLFYIIMENEYEIYRQGCFDFPSKPVWLNEQWKLFVKNNIELLNFKYDKENKDWVYEYEGGLIRII